MLVFIDDILIYSNSYEEHLRIVFQILKERQLFEKLSKYEFWLEQLQLLGHVISQGGIVIDPTKVEARKPAKLVCKK